MSIKARVMQIGEQHVTVVRRAIKNLHLGVYPPDGHVRVAAPLRLTDEAIRLAVIGKLGWIKRQQTGFSAQPRQSPRQVIGGESHFLWGRRYRLDVVPTSTRATFIVKSNTTLQAALPQEASQERRKRALAAFYRKELRSKAAPLVARWAARIGVTVNAWGIKRMKTKWGTCNPAARRIWLNLELAKKPLPCLEYLIVHELMHLLEPTHNARFIELMDRHLPTWQTRRRLLNSEPLAHESWGY